MLHARCEIQPHLRVLLTFHVLLFTVYLFTFYVVLFYLLLLFCALRVTRYALRLFAFTCASAVAVVFAVAFAFAVAFVFYFYCCVCFFVYFTFTLFLLYPTSRSRLLPVSLFTFTLLYVICRCFVLLISCFTVRYDIVLCFALSCSTLLYFTLLVRDFAFFRLRSLLMLFCLALLCFALLSLALLYRILCCFILFYVALRYFCFCVCFCICCYVYCYFSCLRLLLLLRLLCCALRCFALLSLSFLLPLSPLLVLVLVLVLARLRLLLLLLRSHCGSTIVVWMASAFEPMAKDHTKGHERPVGFGPQPLRFTPSRRQEQFLESLCTQSLQSGAMVPPPELGSSKKWFMSRFALGWLWKCNRCQNYVFPTNFYPCTADDLWEFNKRENEERQKQK